MIPIKTKQELAIMAEGGQKLGMIRDILARAVRPGLEMSLLETKARELIAQAGGSPNFCLVRDYPYSICVSVNDEIVHGMPRQKSIKNGDIISVDIGMLYKGWHLDTATTVGAGKISPDDKKLLTVTKQALRKAIEILKPGIPLGNAQCAIQNYIESNGFCVIRNFTGHGIGRELHEEPKIPNYGKKGEGPILQPGMVLAIEPMVSRGDCAVAVKDDGWTAVVKNGHKGAHFEHTIAITQTGCRVLTA